MENDDVIEVYQEQVGGCWQCSFFDIPFRSWQLSITKTKHRDLDLFGWLFHRSSKIFLNNGIPIRSTYNFRNRSSFFVCFRSRWFSMKIVGLILCTVDILG
jgi:hypothetical protein